jgi:arylformamidase
MEVIRYTDPNARDSEEHMSSFGKLLDISTTVTCVLSPGLADHDASSIEQIPLESFVGSCIVETMSGRVTAERIGSVISKASGEASRRILLRGDAVLTEDAVRFLIQYHCLLIGFSQNNESELYTSQHMDSKLYSLQGMNAESRILLAGRVILLTGLDLTGIDDGEYMLHASPVLVSGAYTSPCRAYLIRTY